MYDVNLQHFEHIDSIAIKGGLLGGHQVRRFGAMKVCYEVFSVVALIHSTGPQEERAFIEGRLNQQSRVRVQPDSD